LTMHPGENVGIGGATGAGKATVLDLLLGLVEATAGHVLVDGRPLTERVRAWRRQVGFVPQVSHLLNDSIRGNITFAPEGDPGDDERMWRALEIAQLAEFVRGLPDGPDAMVGERGVRLSGGQRQRLSSARDVCH